MKAIAIYVTLVILLSLLAIATKGDPKPCTEECFEYNDPSLVGVL